MPALSASRTIPASPPRLNRVPWGVWSAEDDTEATGATDALLEGKADIAGSSAALSTSALEPPPLRITNGRLPVNVPREVNAGHGLGAVVRGV